MCDPMTAIAVANAGMQYQQGKAQQKNQFEEQRRQNELAKQNAIQRYSAEQLRINQKVKQTQQKGYEASLKTKETVADFVAQAGGQGVALTGSTAGLMRDYYRTEGQYMSALNTNLGIEIAQYERNLEAIQFGQESQSTYVQPPNPELLFASSTLNVLNSYYSAEAEKELRGLKTNKQKNTYNTGSTSTIRRRGGAGNYK